MRTINYIESLSYDFSTAKICTEGRSCKLTCISRSNECLEQFDEAMRPIVKALSGKLSEQYGASEGADENRKAMLDVLKSPGPAFTKLLEGKNEEEQVFWAEMLVLTSGKERDKSEKFQYSDKEAVGLNERAPALNAAWKATMEAGFTPDGLRVSGGVGDYVKANRPVEVSDEDLEMFWAATSPGLRGNLSKMGDAKGKYWMGDTLDTTAVPTDHGNATEARGKMLMKIYLQQGGRDLYTGQRLPLAESDLEHIIPLSRGLANSEDPMNWGFIRTGINAGRAEKDLDEYTTNALEKNLGVKPGGDPDEKKVKALETKWIKNEEANIAKRTAKAAAEGTDWAQSDKETFDAALGAFKKQGKDYNMVLAIAGKDGVSTTMELPGTPAQIVNNRRGRDYWMKVGAYKTENLPKNESIASWTAAKWRDADPTARKKIEEYWRQTQLDAQQAWQDSDVLSDPKTAKKKAQNIAAEVIKERTDKLIEELGGV